MQLIVDNCEHVLGPVNDLVSAEFGASSVPPQAGGDGGSHITSSV